MFLVTRLELGQLPGGEMGGMAAVVVTEDMQGRDCGGGWPGEDRVGL